jgi:hypothetical protein
MAYPTHTLEELTHAARSDQRDVRSCALQELLGWVEKDPRSHPKVLPIFRAALGVENAPWGIVSAVQGIEHMVGGEEAKSAWLWVLTHSDGSIVVQATSCLTDHSYAPVLLDLLAHRPEIEVRNAAIRALGRLQYVEALPVILPLLGPEETRWDAIESLSNLGDARAIPYLEPYLNDQSALRGEDDRGCTIDVHDITGCAIRRLEHLANTQPTSRPAAPIPARASRPAPLRPGSIPTKHNPFAYLPLAAALLEIPWIIIVFTQVSIPLRGCYELFSFASVNLA